MIRTFASWERFWFAWRRSLLWPARYRHMSATQRQSALKRTRIAESCLQFANALSGLGRLDLRCYHGLRRCMVSRLNRSSSGCGSASVRCTKLVRSRFEHFPAPERRSVASNRIVVSCNASESNSSSLSLGTAAVRERHRFLERMVAESSSPDGDRTQVIVHAMINEDYSEWLAECCDEPTRTWLSTSCPKVTSSTPSQIVLIPEPSTLGLQSVLYLLGTAATTVSSSAGVTGAEGRWLNEDQLWWLIGSLPGKLPAGFDYKIAVRNDRITTSRAALAWALGAYSFDRCKGQASSPGGKPEDEANQTEKSTPSRLVVTQEDLDCVTIDAGATYLARDLINTPASQMSPYDLEMALQELALSYSNTSTSGIVGDDLLSSNFPMIHAVGRGSIGNGVSSKLAPRLAQLRWNEQSEGASGIALVGKGVCFDTGGLDLKPATAMRNMKKDMGGAAAVLAAADMIMARGLDVRLHVLLSCVENAVSSDSFRPGDVLVARNGTTTEIDNTDAEGRLVMADALVAAGENDELALVVDMSTLTGAQRVALGSEIGGVLGTSTAVLDELSKAAYETSDPLWPLPMYEGYDSQLKSNVADVKNCGTTGLGGAISAALYLKRFVPKDVPWLHFDINGYNNSSRPGRPEGGELFGARALVTLIQSMTNAK